MHRSTISISRRPRAVGALAALALAALLGACGSDSSSASGEATPSATSSTTAPAEGLSATEAWVKATEGAAMTDMTGAFMTVLNDSDADVKLVSATSPGVPKVEIHEVVVLDGKNVMQPKSGGIAVPAGGFATLMPGGDHVMLMGLTTPLKVGDEVAITLTFDNGETVDVQAPVKEFTEEMEHYHTGTQTHSPTS